MAVAGVPVQSADHAEKAALFCQAMLLALRDSNEVTGHALQVRIGMHSGPVIAGVIGQTKFTFDVWGEAVNFASRVQSVAAPSTIFCGAATYDLLKDVYHFRCIGKVKVKGYEQEAVVYQLMYRYGGDDIFDALSATHDGATVRSSSAALRTLGGDAQRASATGSAQATPYRPHASAPGAGAASPAGYDNALAAASPSHASAHKKQRAATQQRTRRSAAGLSTVG